MRLLIPYAIIFYKMAAIILNCLVLFSTVLFEAYVCIMLTDGHVFSLLFAMVQCKTKQ